MRENLFRQDDRLSDGPSRLGSTNGICSSADTLVVTELSRMTRSLLNLLETVNLLEQRQVNLVSSRENIDIRTAIHQMERELRTERAAAGRASARARGKTGGRPRTDVAKLENARVLYENSGKKQPTKYAKLSALGGGYFLPISQNNERRRRLFER
jgi:DNA invertase Pin-like site-specific DNA recombinase